MAGLHPIGGMAEQLTELRELHDQETGEKTRDSERIKDTLYSLTTFETSLALVFSQTLTINDRTDVNFIPLIVRYIAILLAVRIARAWVTQYQDVFVKSTGTIFYTILTQLIQFYILLYTYIILREVQAYFNLTVDDTAAIVAIFVFWSLATHIVTSFAANKKFSLVLQFRGQNHASGP